MWCCRVKPCPFCGGRCDPKGWLNGDGVRGPECEGCGATAVDVYAWNFRVWPNSQDLLETIRRVHHTLSVHGHIDRDTDLHKRIIDDLRLQDDLYDYRCDPANQPENIR